MITANSNENVNQFCGYPGNTRIDVIMADIFSTRERVICIIYILVERNELRNMCEKVKVNDFVFIDKVFGLSFNWFKKFHAFVLRKKAYFICFYLCVVF